MSDKINETTLETEEQATQASSHEDHNVGSEHDSFKDQFLRVSADFANYKRRITVERAQWITTGQSAIINAFLPIIDDIERAREATQNAYNESDTQELSHAVEGFSLIEKNLKKIIEELGVTEIDCSGAFDPHLHEALLQTESDAHETGQIVQVLARGYSYKETVLRHAKVSVAS